MQQMTVQGLISTIQCVNKLFEINALILVRANGNFVRFSKVLNSIGVCSAVRPAASHEGELV